MSQDNFSWVNDLPQGVSNFLELLNKNNSNFEFLYSCIEFQFTNFAKIGHENYHDNFNYFIYPLM